MGSITLYNVKKLHCTQSRKYKLNIERIYKKFEIYFYILAKVFKFITVVNGPST